MARHVSSRAGARQVARVKCRATYKMSRSMCSIISTVLITPFSGQIKSSRDVSCVPPFPITIKTDCWTVERTVVKVFSFSYFNIFQKFKKVTRADH